MSNPLLLLLAAGITASSTTYAFIFPRVPNNAYPKRDGYCDIGGYSSSTSILVGISSPQPSHRSKGACHAARLGSLSHAMGKARKRLYIKFRVNVLKKFSLTALRGGRGRLGRAGIPHDEVTFRRRGPDRELTSIPQAERYSSGDWLHNIYNLPGSQVFQRIKGVIILNMIWALLVTAVGTYLNLQAIPSKVHTLLGSSLGLLLVFRTNASYARYWEGRALWEKLHSKTRDLARMISVYEDCLSTEKVTSVARLICAYPLVLREHLTGETHKSDLIRLLGPALSDTMDCSVNKPLWVCNRLALLFRGVPESINFSSRERLVLIGLVNDLSSIIGSCERLVQTPVPLSYARHTSRFLTLYLWSLPMVLVSDLAPVSLVLVTGLCTWALFGILEIGLLIEDPFQRVLKTSWTGVIAETVMRDVQWNIAENRGSSSGASSREPPYSAGTAATTAAASAVAAARFNGM
ncbi:Hypothetical protein NocV09_02400660 [Nannochloropsis oceanica]